MYRNGTDLSVQVCLQCAPGYFLESNFCQASNVTHCHDHANSLLCNRCERGFLPLLIANTTSYCMPDDASLHCAAYDLPALQARRVECKICQPDFVLTRSYTDSLSDRCLKFTTVPTCVSYRPALSIANQTFVCDGCDDKHFLFNNTCVVRKNFIINCHRYNSTNDECLTCNEGFYIAEDNNSCVPFPTGIEGCESYSSMTKCSRCHPEYYLFEDQCIAIDRLNLVENCDVHLAPGVCAKCTEGFLEKAGNCVAVLATDCANYDSPYSCRDCPPGFIFQRNATSVICVVQPDPHCTANSDHAPYGCLACEDGYYVQNNVCTNVTTPIPFCVIYQNATVCSRCETGHLLSVDQLSCVPAPTDFRSWDPLCVDMQLADTPQCDMCDPGFYFKDGQCVACSDTTGQKGCAACDPRNPHICYFCHSGFIMTNTGLCITDNTAEITDSSFIAFVRHLQG